MPDAFFPRPRSEYLFMHPVKMGIAVEARIDTGFQQGLTVLMQGAGEEEPFIIEVLIDGHAGDGTENPTQMVLVEKESVCKSVQCDPLRQMIVQPQQDIPDPLILHYRFGQRLFDLVQLVEKFKEHAFGDPQSALLQIAVDFQKQRDKLPFRNGRRNLTVRAEGTAKQETFQLFAAVLPEKFHRDEYHDPSVARGR